MINVIAYFFKKDKKLGKKADPLRSESKNFNLKNQIDFYYILNVLELDCEKKLSSFPDFIFALPHHCLQHLPASNTEGQYRRAVVLPGHRPLPHGLHLLHDLGLCLSGLHPRPELSESGFLSHLYAPKFLERGFRFLPSRNRLQTFPGNNPWRRRIEGNT